jgi:hypothetical protein
LAKYHYCHERNKLKTVEFADLQEGMSLILLTTNGNRIKLRIQRVDTEGGLNYLVVNIEEMSVRHQFRLGKQGILTVVDLGKGVSLEDAPGQMVHHDGTPHIQKGFFGRLAQEPVGVYFQIDSVTVRK